MSASLDPTFDRLLAEARDPGAEMLGRIMAGATALSHFQSWFKALREEASTEGLDVDMLVGAVMTSARFPDATHFVIDDESGEFRPATTSEIEKLPVPNLA